METIQVLDAASSAALLGATVAQADGVLYVVGGHDRGPQRPEDATRRAVDAAAESFRAAGAACPFEPEARSAALEAIARDLIYAGAAPLRPANVASAKVAAAAATAAAEAAAAAAVAGQHLGTLRYRRKPRGPGARRRNRGGRRLLAFDARRSRTTSSASATTSRRPAPRSRPASTSSPATRLASTGPRGAGGASSAGATASACA